MDVVCVFSSRCFSNATELCFSFSETHCASEAQVEYRPAGRTRGIDRRRSEILPPLAALTRSISLEGSPQFHRTQQPHGMVGLNQVNAAFHGLKVIVNFLVLTERIRKHFDPERMATFY